MALGDIPVQKPAALPEYEKLRKQAVQRSNQEAQNQTEALNRRLASIGNLQSGAALKQSQNVANAVADQREQALSQLDVAEGQEVQRRKEVTEGRDYASKEAQLGRDFNASENAANRTIQQDQFGKQFGLQADVFNEQKSQNKFMNKLALDEKKLNEFMTKYNAALSLGTSNAQGAISDAFGILFPEDSFEFGGKVSTGSASKKNLFSDNAQKAFDQFNVKPGDFAMTGMFGQSKARADMFRSQAKAAGYTDAAIERAIQQGSGGFR